MNMLANRRQPLMHGLRNTQPQKIHAITALEALMLTRIQSLTPSVVFTTTSNDERLPTEEANDGLRNGGVCHRDLKVPGVAVDDPTTAMTQPERHRSQPKAHIESRHCSRRSKRCQQLSRERSAMAPINGESRVCSSIWRE